MNASRRIASSLIVLGLAGSLAGCGDDNPFGTFVRGTAPAEDTTATAATTSPRTTSGTPTSPTTTVATTSPTETEAGTDGPTGDATDGDGPTSSPGTGTGTSTPGSGTGTTGGAGAAPTGDTVQVDGRTIQGMPPGLTFPNDARVEATTAFGPASGSVVVSAPEEEELFSFFRSSLAAGDYRIASDAAGVLAFTGNGFRGSLVGKGDGGVLTWAPEEN